MKTTLFTLLPLAFVAGVMAAAIPESTTTGKQKQDGKPATPAGNPSDPCRVAGDLKYMEIHGPPFDLSKLPTNAGDAAKVQQEVIEQWKAECKVQVKHVQREAVACPGLGAGDYPENLKTYATCAGVVRDAKGKLVSVTYYTKKVAEQFKYTLTEGDPTAPPNPKGGPKNPSEGELKLPPGAIKDPVVDANARAKVWYITADFTAKGYFDKTSEKDQGIEWQRLNKGFVDECKREARDVLPQLADQDIYAAFGRDPNDNTKYQATCFNPYTDPQGKHFMLYYTIPVSNKFKWTATEMGSSSQAASSKTTGKAPVTNPHEAKP